MSGFAGIVRLEPSLEGDEADRATIARMAEAIAFRGPDAQQQWRQNGASFAFSLLTTGPAPQAASQPVTLDGNTWLIGDVRCDGRDDLIATLEQHGVLVSRSASSEELVLHFFSRFGADALPRLHGDFSFVIWQVRQRRLQAFRDLTGPRPFFYSLHDGVLLFSNTLQALLSSPNLPRDRDESFLADFLLGNPNFDPAATVWRSVRRLPAGHLLEFSKNALQIRRIAHAPVEEILVLKSEEEYVEEFRRLLNQAVRDQLPDNETTIMLSGGLDSTSIAACAVALRKSNSAGQELKLYSISTDNRPLVDDPEADLAAFAAGFLGVPCQIVHSGEDLPYAGWEDSHDEFPEPVLDPYSKLYLDYYRLVSKNTRVVLTGNGGDEFLRVQGLPYLKYLRQRQGSFAAVMVLGGFLVNQRKLPSLGAGIRSGVLRLFGKKLPSPTYPPWLNRNYEDKFDLRARWSSMNAVPQSPHPFNPKAYAVANDLFVAPLLEFFDATWTCCALEPRNPFLDRRLTRFLLRIPIIPWAMEKHLLRRSQAGILPEKIRQRPKTPLLFDALLVHASSGRWKPSTVLPHDAYVERAVDVTILNKYLSATLDESLYLHLRPVSLARW